MHRFAHWLSHHPARALIAVAVVTAAALAGIVNPLTGELRLRVDPALNELLPDDDTSRRFYESLRDRFGSDDTLVIALEADNIFTASVLRHVVRITRRIESLEGVQRVHSLANAPGLPGIDGELALDPLLDKIPTGSVEVASLRRAVLEDPVHVGNLVSRDGRVAAMVVHLEDMPEDELLERRLDLSVAELARRDVGDAQVWMAGTPHVKAEMSRILMSDLESIVPAIVALMILISHLSFRSLAGTLVPVGTILIALTWTLGAMAWAGHALNIITTIVPPLVLIVGFAYVIHVVTAYRSAARAIRAGEPRESPVLVAHALERVAFPVVLTAVTTAAGFLSLMAQPLGVIREFGAFAAVGVMAALAAALVFAPAVFALAPAPRVGPLDRREGRMDELAERLARFDLRHRWWILGGGAVVLVASLLTMTRVVVNTEIIGNFEPEAAVRVSYEAINEHLEGANSFYVVLEAPEGGDFKEPSNLRQVRDLQDWLEQQPEIGGTTSLVDYLMGMHQAFEDGDPSQRRLPASRRLVAQLLWFGGSEDLDRFVDARYRTATILVRSTVTASREMGLLVKRIEGRLEPGLSARVTGNSVLLSRTSDEISRGQALSLTAAFAMIYLVLTLYFRSPRLGFVALIPNALPVVVYFGALGVTGVTLNNATALMGCIVLGIAVDDTIHFLVHFRTEARRLGSEAKGAIAALRTVGRPVTYTTVVLCLGLLLITTSDLKTQTQFGALGAFTLAVAWFVDVVLTPALCSVMRVLNLEDAADSSHTLALSG